MRISTLLAASTLATALLAALPLSKPAHAETTAEKEAIAEQEAQEKAKRAQEEKERKAKEPPPAIPGAEFSGDAAPPTKNPADMSPNEALFDAINRGDGPAARDAMSRGAQLDAKNLLGQTPLDAAIEANRSDITFLLLSLRGSAGSGGHRPAPAAQAQVAYHPPTVTSRHVAAAPVAAPPARVADRGTPNPAVGFTGF